MPGETTPSSSLAGFIKLGDGQHWYRPSRPSTDSGSETRVPARPTVQPDLVIFCAWLFAAQRHIAKYIAQYRLMYPGAQILLLENNLANIAWVSDKTQTQTLQPAVRAVREVLETGSLSEDDGTEKRKEPNILLHAFSNGGCHSAVQLAQAYRESVSILSSSAQPKSLVPVLFELPISALVLDSAPGRPDFSVGVKVVLSSITPKATYPRLLAAPFAVVLIAWIRAMHEMGIVENVASKLWRCLNDVGGPFLLRAGSGGGGGGSNGDIDGSAGTVVPRTYIYSTRDDMVPWQNVLEHAGEARAAVIAHKCSKDSVVQDPIRLEGFPGSMHVNHVSVDPGRYWRVVREAVERSVVSGTKT